MRTHKLNKVIELLVIGGVRVQIGGLSLRSPRQRLENTLETLCISRVPNARQESVSARLLLSLRAYHDQSLSWA